MNWSKAKTILIIFFILLDAVLLIDIIYTNNETEFISSDIIASTAQILSNNNIQIDANLIPHKTSSMKTIEVSNIIDDYISFSKRMLRTEQISQENENIYTASGQKITFSADLFYYEAETPVLSELTQNINVSNAETIATRILKQYGFDMADIESVVEQRNDSYMVKLTKLIGQTPVFDSSVFIELSSRGVSKIYGSWFIPVKQGHMSKILSLRSAVSILIDFITNPIRPQEQVSITGLRSGYAIYENTQYHRTIILVPVWQITLDNGLSYCLDARQTD